MTFLHFDEAKPAAETTLREWLASIPQVTKALLVGDLFGKLRLAIWSSTATDTSTLDQNLRNKCGEWWSGAVLQVEQEDEVTRGLYAGTWSEGRPDPDDPRLVMLDRHRHRTPWLVAYV